MTLNPNLYRFTLDAIKPAILDAHSKNDLRNTLTLLSLGSHVPFIAVLAYAMRPDVLGFLPELIQSYEITQEFYKYDEITEWSDL